MKFTLRLVALLIGIASLNACTYHVRESNIVIPRVAPSPDLIALRSEFANYHIDQNHIVTADGAKLHSVRFLRSDAVATLLYFGGNGYTVGRLAPRSVRMYRDAPVNIVLVDHRGYGGSSGTPTMEKLLSDALETYDATLNDPALGKVPLIVHGHSLGSFLAGHVAANRRISGVILESSVSSAEEWTSHLRSKQSRWIRLLVRRVVPEGGLAGKGNRKVAASLDEPALFVVGAQDDITPTRFSQSLYDSAPLSKDDKQLLIVPNKGHMNATDSPEFKASLSVFVARAREPK